MQSATILIFNVRLDTKKIRKMENIKIENLGDLLNTFINKNNLKVESVAKKIRCSIPSLNRILGKESLPTDEMLKQSGVLIYIGFDKYKKTRR